MQSTFHNSNTHSIVSKETHKTTSLEKFVKTGRFVVKPPEISLYEKQNFLMDLKLDEDPGDILLDDPLMLGLMRIKGVKSHND